MRINNIKENKKFQIIVCIIIGFLMIWSRIYIEKAWQEFDIEWRNLDKEIEKLNDDIDNLEYILNSI